MRRSNTIIASLMVKLGDADAMICGLVGTYETHLERIRTSWAMPRRHQLRRAERVDDGCTATAPCSLQTPM